MKNMWKLSALAALAMTAVACQADTSSLDKKLDSIDKKLADLQKQVAAGGGRAAGQQRPPRPEPDRAKTYSVAIDGDPFQGPADAKVTVVKAYDYACPFCEKVRDTMDDLRKKYGNDVRIVYKQFVVHPQVATAGALAACAASKQGGVDKFVAMDNLLWDKGFKGRQFDKDVDGGAPSAEKGSGSAAPAGAPVKCWESAGGCPVVLGYAKELGLDEAKFKADMKGDCQQLIAKDMKDLQQLGVGATPSFFINGRFLSGAGPIEGFEAVIDEELKKANEKIQSGVPAAQYYQQVIVGQGQKTLDAPKPQ